MGDRVVHFEIPFDDAERARSFYRDAFGWEITVMPDMVYSLVACGPTDPASGPTEPGFINGGLVRRGQVAAPVIVIDVPDIDGALEKITASGGAAVTERTPVGDFGYSAYFTDPEGNLMALWQNN